jgi:hypothetical protein
VVFEFAHGCVSKDPGYTYRSILKFLSGFNRGSRYNILIANKMPSDTTNGILACFSGFCFHLVVGGMLTWGNITVYVTSYLRLYNPEITLEDTFVVLPATLTTMYLTM